MTTFQIIVLSLVQGLTEFLPVSSSAHLILANRALGYADQGLVFDVATHLGTLLAVLLYFRREIVQLLRGRHVDGFSETARGHAMIFWLAVATLPTAVAGFLLADFIEARLRSTGVIATTTIVFALLLGWADRVGGRGARIGLAAALAMGLAQVLALVPGTSRAGVTMTAGLFFGLTRQAAARFSFLMAIPAVSAAGAFGIREMMALDATIHWRDFLLAVGCSGLAAYLCIGAFLGLVDRIGMLPFVVYRLLLGAVLAMIALQLF